MDALIHSQEEIVRALRRFHRMYPTGNNASINADPLNAGAVHGDFHACL
jgi:hypothetical protein